MSSDSPSAPPSDPGFRLVTSVRAMRPLLVHASSKAQSPLRRRVLHVEYAAKLCLHDGAELAVA